jgi:hypothetical protein
MHEIDVNGDMDDGLKFRNLARIIGGESHDNFEPEKLEVLGRWAALSLQGDMGVVVKDIGILFFDERGRLCWKDPDPEDPNWHGSPLPEPCDEEDMTVTIARALNQRGKATTTTTPIRENKNKNKHGNNK